MMTVLPFLNATQTLANTCNTDLNDCTQACHETSPGSREAQTKIGRCLHACKTSHTECLKQADGTQSTLTKTSSDKDATHNPDAATKNQEFTADAVPVSSSPVKPTAVQAPSAASPAAGAQAEDNQSDAGNDSGQDSAPKPPVISRGPAIEPPTGPSQAKPKTPAIPDVDALKDSAKAKQAIAQANTTAQANKYTE